MEIEFDAKNLSAPLELYALLSIFALFLLIIGANLNVPMII